MAKSPPSALDDPIRTALSRRGVFPLLGMGLGATAIDGAAVAQPMPAPLTDDAPGTVLQPGLHRVPANVTIRGDLVLLPGARIEIAQGRTLTVLGQFDAPKSHVFLGLGRIDLNRGRTPAAYPEWWGAAPGDGNADCLPALTACLAAHPVMLLGAGDYYISGTWAIERGYCRIWGSGYRGTEDGRGTRILVRSGSDDVIRVGPERKPASVNDFLQAVDLRWVNLSRASPVDGGGGRQPAGLDARFLLCCQFEGISAFEHAVGFRATGTVRCLLRDCMAFRSLPGRQTDLPFRGFLLDGMADIGLAGGNGSIFLLECNVALGGEPRVADPVGILLDGGFADSYILNFETANVACGIRVAGRAGELGRRGMDAHGNLHIHMPIIDQCRDVGIEISDTSEHSLVDISNPYIAVARGARAGIRLDRYRGAVSISGGQLHGRTDLGGGGNAAGLDAVDSRGLNVSDLKIRDHRRPVRFLRCRGLAVRAWVGNPTHPGEAAVALAGCAVGNLCVQVTGRDQAFPVGVVVAEDCADLRIDVSAVEPRALAGPRAGRDGRPLVTGRHGTVTIEGT